MGLGGKIYLVHSEPSSLLMGSSQTSLITENCIRQYSTQIRVSCLRMMPMTLALVRNIETS